MSSQRRAPRRARACLLADVLIFSGCAVVALQSVGSAWSYYQHGRQARRQQAYDAVYGSSFWTDDCMLEHLHDRNSKPSHYYANVSKGVCTLGYVGDALEERQAMVWASPSLNMSATLVYGFLAAASAGPRRAVLPLLLSMPIGTDAVKRDEFGAIDRDDPSWAAYLEERTAKLLAFLEGRGPHPDEPPGEEVVGMCARNWDPTGEEYYYFMEIIGYDEASKTHDCRYVDGYLDGGRGGQVERFDLGRYLEVIHCKEEHLGYTIKVYDTACSENYREGKIVHYDVPTDEYVLRFPDGTEKGYVLEVESIEFCDVPRDMDYCPVGADDPCEDVCEDCEMDEVDQTCSADCAEDGDGVCTKEDDPDGSTEKGYKRGDVVEVLKCGRYYAATVDKVRVSDGRLAVFYKVPYPPPGKNSESGVELARVRWPVDEDDSEDGSEDVFYRKDERIEVLYEGNHLEATITYVNPSDGTLSVIYKDGDSESGIELSRARKLVKDEASVDPLLDTCWLENMDQYDAMKTYLEGIQMPGGKNAYKHLMETIDSALTVTFENHAVISQETDCFTDMRSAAPTFMMQKRCSLWALTRCETLKSPSFKLKNKKASDDVALQLCSLYESLGVTSKHGNVMGPYRDVAHATDRVRHGQLTNVKKGAGWHLGTDITCLMYKGTQMAVRSGHLSPWIPERFSCTFAKYSGTRTLALNWAEGFFGDEELCDACQFPRDAKVRIWDVLHKQKNLPKGAVFFIGVSGPHYIEHALKRNSEGLNMFVGAVFDAEGYDASDASLKGIAQQGRSAPDGYWGKYEERHGVPAKIYEALDAAGLIPSKAPRANTPVFEYNQLVVPLNVGDGLYRGATGVCKGLECAVVVDKVFYGNEHTFEYMKLWDDSWQITQDFLRLADVTSFDELTLAPLPKKTGYVIDYGGGVGFHQLKWVPEGQIASSSGGGQRVKRKREEREMREMRCYRHDCPLEGEPFPIYCPRDGVWRDDDFLESQNGPRCPTCHRGQCQLV
jgi:hypothetical protein